MWSDTLKELLLLAVILIYILQVADEVKYIKSLSVDRNLQLDELRSKMEENMSIESTQKKASEDQIQSSLSAILSSDESRRSFCQLSLDEDQQIVSVIYDYFIKFSILARSFLTSKFTLYRRSGFISSAC